MGFLTSHRLLAWTIFAVVPTGVWSLWPIPSELQTGTTGLILSPSFQFDIAIPAPPADLVQAIIQTQYYLENDQLGRLVVGRGANDTYALEHANVLESLILTLTEGAEVNPISTESIKPLGGRSEEYSLTIPEDGSAATLSANSTLGLYRGLTTFTQLWYYYGGVTYTLIAPICIIDAPAYVSGFRAVESLISETLGTALSGLYAGHREGLVRLHHVLEFHAC